MALAGVSARAKELLRLTSLDMVWPIYASRQEAMEALLAD
jgi:anti-sigma B factor antagonist